MSRSVKVSVIMAEYNTNVDHLKSSIKSILAQSFGDFEFIIVDDRGRNDVERILAEFNDSRVRLIVNKSNLGLVDSLNIAIRESAGKYVVRMDTDDIALPHRIQRLYDFIVANPEYAVVGSRVEEFSDDKVYGILSVAGEKSAKDIMRGLVPVHPSVILNKKSVQEVGGYKDYKRAEDLVLWMELLMNGNRLYILKDVMLRYRVNPSDYSKRTIKHRGGEIKARLHYYPKLGAGPVEYFRIIKTIIAGIVPGYLMRKYRSWVLVRDDR